MKALHGAWVACCLVAFLACSTAPKRVPAGLPPPEYEAPRVGTSTGGAEGQAAGHNHSGGVRQGGSEANPAPKYDPTGAD